MRRRRHEGHRRGLEIGGAWRLHGACWLAHDGVPPLLAGGAWLLPYRGSPDRRVCSAVLPPAKAVAASVRAPRPSPSAAQRHPPILSRGSGQGEGRSPSVAFTLAASVARHAVRRPPWQVAVRQRAWGTRRIGVRRYESSSGLAASVQWARRRQAAYRLVVAQPRRQSAGRPAWWARQWGLTRWWRWKPMGQPPPAW